MKQIIFSTLAVAGLFTFISCERHSWEDSEGKKDGVKNLYPKKEKAHHGGDGAHDAKGEDGHEGQSH